MSDEFFRVIKSCLRIENRNRYINFFLFIIKKIPFFFEKVQQTIKRHLLDFRLGFCLHNRFCMLVREFIEFRRVAWEKKKKRKRCHKRILLRFHHLGRSFSLKYQNNSSNRAIHYPLAMFLKSCRIFRFGNSEYF